MPELLRFDQPRGAEPPCLEGIFLGWRPGPGRPSSMILTSPEDSAAILGPPRSGKTGGVLIPAALTWFGSLISASTKTDVLRATRGRRLDLAVRRGGDVYVYAPADRAAVLDGVRNVRWSPLAGCEDPAVCEERVTKVLGPRRADQNEDEFFRQQAATVLRGYFHAAALARLSMRRVKRWVDDNDPAEPMEILRSFVGRVPSAESYLSSLRGIARQAPETKSSTYSTVNAKLGPLINNAVVLEGLEDPDFDIDEFLTTGSTLYIVSPENVQETIAPLITGLVEAIVTRAYTLAARAPNGRIDPALLLLLDEVGAIAPLPTLPQIMAQGASQGILCVWAAQVFSQLKAKWGEDWANAILGSSAHKLIFGGASADVELLNQFSAAFGERDRWVSPHGEGRAGMIRGLAAVIGRQAQPPTFARQKVLEVADIHQLGQGKAMVLASTPTGPSFDVIAVPHAAVVEPFRTAIAREAAVQAGLRGAPGEPVHLRAQALVAVLFQSMPAGEQRRFRREEQELVDRVNAFENLPEHERRARLARDPAWGREVRSARALAGMAAEARFDQHARIVEAFATGAVAHFTFTVVPAAPEPAAAPRQVHRLQRWSESR